MRKRILLFTMLLVFVSSIVVMGETVVFQNGTSEYDGCLDTYIKIEKGFDIGPDDDRYFDENYCDDQTLILSN